LTPGGGLPHLAISSDLAIDWSGEVLSATQTLSIIYEWLSEDECAKRLGVRENARCRAVRTLTNRWHPGHSRSERVGEPMTAKRRPWSPSQLAPSSPFVSCGERHP
jgi:hypothetical protein